MLKYGRTFDPVCNAAMESFSVAFDHTRRNGLLDDLLLFDITDETALVDEYADWLGFDLNLSETSETSGLNAGRDLGVAAAVLYNALVKNAKRRGHKSVSRLCLNVNAIVDGGMELDRKGKGWIAFRLLFESRP
jgi:hypothetical protein